jgi:SufS family cysteine desulfurase
MSTFDVASFRAQFPLLSCQANNQPLVYFDNGATTQKPIAVIEAGTEYYQAKNANVHRASHALSKATTTEFEQCREKVKEFIHAADSTEIIWTKGSTEAINLVAQSWGRCQLGCGDEIVLSYAEHHANIVPWQLLAEQVGATIKIIELDSFGYFDEHSVDSIITLATKIVCINHASNVLGKVNPVEKIIAKARSVGALTLIDGAQVIANKKVNVQALDCDFYVFSAHKMFGPTGLGVLYGKKALLQTMTPYQGGGEMIKQVSFSATTFAELPFKFEAGTPNIAGVVGFASALEFITHYQLNGDLAHKQHLIDYCYEQLSTIESLQFIVDGKPDLAIFSFNITNQHPQDIAIALDHLGIAARSGEHCAMPLFEYLGLRGCVRLSLAAYNTLQEIDFVVDSLKKVITDDENIPNKQQTEPLSELVLAKFRSLHAWQDKHREIIMLGKNLIRMPKEKRNSHTLVHGCESQVWLEVRVTNSNKVKLSADSDAKIIRGLLAIVFAALNDKTVEQVISFDMQNYFSQLGLKQHLSPSRGNGLLAIVEKIIKHVTSDN